MPRRNKAEVVQITLTRSQGIWLGIAVWLALGVLAALVPYATGYLYAGLHGASRSSLFGHGELFTSSFALAAAVASRGWGFFRGGKGLTVWHLSLVLAAGCLLSTAALLMGLVQGVSVEGLLFWISVGYFAVACALGAVAELVA